MSKREIAYGGQAVLEGVMMRGASTCAVAVRAPEGNITVHTEPLGPLYRSRLARLPFLRGLIVLWDTLGLGVRALTFSANIQAGPEQEIEPGTMALTLAFSVVLALGMFFLVPAGAGFLVERMTGWNAWWTNLVEGLLRLGLLLGYVWAVGFLPDVRRVFAYHGAEHKTINAFEADAALDPETVARFPKEHARCGTAFLLTVVVLSVVLFGLLGPLPLLPRLLTRLALIPVLVALAYETMRLTARHSRSPWVAPLLYPNLALQKLTTREPDAAMIEVALVAFRTMRTAEDSAGSSI
jgi:uncharacterized protein YqhQ